MVFRSVADLIPGWVRGRGFKRHERFVGGEFGWLILGNKIRHVVARDGSLVAWEWFVVIGEESLVRVLDSTFKSSLLLGLQFIPTLKPAMEIQK